MPTSVDLPGVSAALGVAYHYLSFAWNGGSEKDHTESRLKSSAWMFYQIAVYRDIRFQVQLTQFASTQPQWRAMAAGALPAQRCFPFPRLQQIAKFSFFRAYFQNHNHSAQQ